MDIAILTNKVAYNLTGTNRAHTLIGNNKSNILTGGDGRDILDGKGGADTMIGGGGADTYYVDNIRDVVIEGGTFFQVQDNADTIRSSISFDLSTDGENIENLTLLGNKLINATGNDRINIITGNSGHNRLDGGLEADTLAGGKGNDTYIIDTMDTVSENENEGVDTVIMTKDFDFKGYTLGDNLENLILQEQSPTFAAIGNALNNKITGNSKQNRITGEGGRDTLIGGGGNDTYVVNLIQKGTNNKNRKLVLEDKIIDKQDNARDTYDFDTLELTMDSSTAFAEQSKVSKITLLPTIEKIDASRLAIDINLTGNRLNNSIYGSRGDNVINGGKGADHMSGNDGNDTYIVDNALDSIAEYLNGGTDTVKVGINTQGGTYSLAINVEHVTLTNNVAFNINGSDVGNVLTGNKKANIINGFGGNDKIDGKGGADTLAGGLGDDSYFVDNKGDTVIEAASQGRDSIFSSVSFDLSTDGNHVERLFLGSIVNGVHLSTGKKPLNGTGNDLSNIMWGNAGKNKLDGGIGNDILYGRSGNDRLIGGSGKDT